MSDSEVQEKKARGRPRKPESEKISPAAKKPKNDDGAKRGRGRPKGSLNKKKKRGAIKKAAAGGKKRGRKPKAAKPPADEDEEEDGVVDDGEE
ncbi:hypothetical protein BIW11_09490 [Tropilaelaps mercedesae]|uniref:Uncharacterized protein n=1 Tax=Tropilaelaps mercedesae TaxID=418985 RepID=A0A1V9XJV9_9ACAR|nr:hypothetical protein BIW11_09490 [Tropilaelaps mercedesae]